MQTIKVELLNDHALKLLQQLEQLKILRLLDVPEPGESSSSKRQWAGTLSKSTAQKMLHAIEESRNEWERNI